MPSCRAAGIGHGALRLISAASCMVGCVAGSLGPCPNCGGKRRLLAAIQDPDSIQRVLRSLGLSGEVPELAPARAPPGGEGWFGA